MDSESNLVRLVRKVIRFAGASAIKWFGFDAFKVIESCEEFLISFTEARQLMVSTSSFITSKHD